MRKRLLSIFPRKRRFKRNEDGSAAVEFALVIIPFIASLFAIIEIGLVFLAGQVLETSVGDASRMIMTGQAQAWSQADAITNFRNKVCSTSVMALFTCANIKFDVRPVDGWNANASNPSATSAAGTLDTPVVNPTTNQLDTASFTYNPGTQCQIVIVRVVYEWPTFVRGLGLDLATLANGKRLLMATTAFRNEPYSGTGFC